QCQPPCLQGDQRARAWPRPGRGQGRRRGAGQQSSGQTSWLGPIGPRASLAAVAAASSSRSQSTSTWSETKPIGDTTTAAVPAAASAARWSLTSGSSQGTDGGPDRDCQTTSNSAPGPRTASATSRDASRSCAV